MKNNKEVVLSNEELQKMVSAKQIEANLAAEDNLSLLSKIKDLELRSLKVFKENEILKAAPEMSTAVAKMEMQLRMADVFVQSGAFNVKNAQEAYVKIQTGDEMHMKPMESMQSLYIVNGSVEFYGKGMVARLTGNGYTLEYINETPNGVTVVLYKDGNKIATEVVKDTDQIIKHSKAAKFAKKNKMRYHGVRMLCSFYVPHLFKSVSDMFEREYHEYSEPTKKATSQTEKDALLWIENVSSIDILEKAVDRISDIDSDDVSLAYEEKRNELIKIKNPKKNGQ